MSLEIGPQEGLLRTDQSTDFLHKSTFIFVLGGPGSGKGTLCTRLATEYDLQHLSVGDVLRSELTRPNSKYASIIRDNMMSGKVGPPQITVSLLLDRMREWSAGHSSSLFVIDGK
jgi:UMP-CMP kinase